MGGGRREGGITPAGKRMYQRHTRTQAVTCGSPEPVPARYELAWPLVSHCTCGRAGGVDGLPRPLLHDRDTAALQIARAADPTTATILHLPTRARARSPARVGSAGAPWPIRPPSLPPPRCPARPRRRPGPPTSNPARAERAGLLCTPGWVAGRQMTARRPALARFGPRLGPPPWPAPWPGAPAGNTQVSPAAGHGRQPGGRFCTPRQWRRHDVRACWPDMRAHGQGSAAPAHARPHATRSPSDAPPPPSSGWRARQQSGGAHGRRTLLVALLIIGPSLLICFENKSQLPSVAALVAICVGGGERGAGTGRGAVPRARCADQRTSGPAERGARQI